MMHDLSIAEKYLFFCFLYAMDMRALAGISLDMVFLMKFSFRHVEIFWAVMTTGSATAAAEMLHTSQPTISRELSRFEKLTKLTLFARSGGRLVPTEQGRMLFDEVQRSHVGLERIGNAAEAIRHFRYGQIALACLPAFSVSLLPRACQQFSRLFPDVSICVTPLEPPFLQESLSSQRYHLGLTEEPSAPPGTEVEQLLVVDLVCVLPVGHRLANQPILAPQDFADEDFVYLAPTDPYRTQVDKVFRDNGVVRRMVVETHSAAAVCATVQHGVGVAIVNPLTALDFEPLGVCIRRFAHSIPFSVNLVLPSHRPESLAVSHFVKALRFSSDQIRGRLHAIVE